MNANDSPINYKFVFFFIVLIIFNFRIETNTSKRRRKLRNNNTILSKQKSSDDDQLIQQTYFYNQKDFNYMHDYDYNYNYNEFYEKKIDYWNITKVPKGMYINKYFENEIKFFHFFQNLKKMPKNLSAPIVQKEKKNILQNISNNVGMNVSSINEIYFNTEFRFGNELIAINKFIFFCEIIGVKKIIINSDNNLYIKNTIYDKEYNLTIEINNNNNLTEINNNNYFNNNFENNNYQNNYVIDMEKPGYYTKYNQNFTFTNSNSFPNLFMLFFNLKIENRFSVIKAEILKNLPKVKVKLNDLYIHIRSGDIFSKEASSPSFAPSYAQLPLCFYTKIIEQNKFNKIYIISEDKLNPIIDILLTKYKNIIYNNNSLETDISYLIYAYNIVGSISSFITSIIKLNDNLKKFWEYDIYQMEHKLYHLHHSLYDYPRNYTIYRMEPSEEYKKEMYIWTKSDKQLKIMINDTCPNKFKIKKKKKK